MTGKGTRNCSSSLYVESHLIAVTEKGRFLKNYLLSFPRTLFPFEKPK